MLFPPLCLYQLMDILTLFDFFLCVVICQLWRATTTHTDIHVYTHKTHWRLEPQRRTDNKMTPSSTPVNFSSDAKPRRPVLIVSYRLSLSLPHLTSFSLSLFSSHLFFLLGFFFFYSHGQLPSLFADVSLAPNKYRPEIRPFVCATNTQKRSFVITSL